MTDILPGFCGWTWTETHEIPESKSVEFENGKFVTENTTVFTVDTPMYRGLISSNTDLLTLQNLSLKETRGLIERCKQ